MKFVFLVLLVAIGFLLIPGVAPRLLQGFDPTGDGDGFYNTLTRQQYSRAEIARARELIDEERVRGREQAYLEDCSVQSGIVKAIAGPSFSGWFSRADRENLLETLFVNYSALQEISAVEIHSVDGRLLATYLPGRGYSEPGLPSD